MCWQKFVYWAVPFVSFNTRADDVVMSCGDIIRDSPMWRFWVDEATDERACPSSVATSKRQMEPNGAFRVHLVPFIHRQSYRLVWVRLDPILKTQGI